MLTKAEKQALVVKYGKDSNDTARTEVQIAILSADIKKLTGHMQEHKHDNSTKRGLVTKVSQRKKLLSYLKGKDINRYRAIITDLGIRG